MVNATVVSVSVTQQFNTTTSIGRLTLNILLSFAQFEREINGDNNTKYHVTLDFTQALLAGSAHSRRQETAVLEILLDVFEARREDHVHLPAVAHGNCRTVLIHPYGTVVFSGTPAAGDVVSFSIGGTTVSHAIGYGETLQGSSPTC